MCREAGVSCDESREAAVMSVVVSFQSWSYMWLEQGLATVNGSAGDWVHCR